jgi:hypothetical protein
MDDTCLIEDAAWPLVVVRAPRIFAANAAQTMMQGLDRVLERRTSFALLVDTRRIEQPPNAVQRKVLAKWMTERMASEALYDVGNAVVITSVAARAALTAIHWLRRPVTKHCFVRTMLEGIDWCVDRLREKHVAVPDTIAKLRAAESEAK